MGGNSDSGEVASRLGLPVELIGQAEAFRYSGDEIYPDNVLTVAVFRRMLTQWNVGTGGAVGFRYESLDRVFRRCRVPEDQEDEVFDGLQAMERSALEAMRCS